MPGHAEQFPSMKSTLTVCLLAMTSLTALSQTDGNTKTPAKPPVKLDLSKRPSDHLMLQVGYSGWAPKPDSVLTKGFSRTLNVQFFFDFPFKADPRYSVGIGLGVGTDNIYLDKTTVDLKGRTQASFRRDTVSRYKRYKLTSVHMEAPLELRYASRPADMNKSFKAAIGLRIGMPWTMYSKAKVDRDLNGLGGYVLKEKDTKYMNSIRALATMRVGYGNVSLFGTYSLTPVFKEGFGPKLSTWTAGVSISGL
ncbi:MAG: hypothetical protein EBZ67_11525 [Chitinophagia bacterium]|nr:hypothetical protein [Chitinophagia bacterium]